jgi:5-methylcytosine-specific restriction endonuclease McrA
MKKFISGQTASHADQAIKSSLKTMESAKQCSVLWFAEINERKLFLELGHASINQYAAQELNFSSSRTGDYLSLCRSFEKLPKVKEKVESGELGYTAARVVAQVANEETEDQWVEFGLNHSRRELEIEAKRAKQDAADAAVGQASLLPVQPKSRPAAVVQQKVILEMSPTQLARYEALWEKVRKQRNVSADKVEALLEIMGDFLTESSPRGEHLPSNKPPVQIHIHHCSECEKATTQTSKGELEIGKAELEKAQCDCQISQPGQRNTTSIAPSVRRLVFARARHQCQYPGCNHTRFLEIHHVVPRSEGGGNDPDNCICLCSTHHALHHKHKFGKVGVGESQGIYSWNSLSGGRIGLIPAKC